VPLSNKQRNISVYIYIYIYVYIYLYICIIHDEPLWFVYDFLSETKHFVVILFDALLSGEYMSHAASNKGPPPAATVAPVAPSQKVKVETANVNAATVVPKQLAQVDLNAISNSQQFDSRSNVDSIPASVKPERIESVDKLDHDRKIAPESVNRVSGYYDQSNSRNSENNRNGSPVYRDRKRRLSPAAMVSLLVFLCSFFSYSVIYLLIFTYI